MKKILFSILGILIGFVGFSNADFYGVNGTSIGNYINSGTVRSITINTSSSFNLSGFRIKAPVLDSSFVNTQKNLFVSLFGNIFNNVNGVVVSSGKDRFIDITFDSYLINSSFTFNLTGFSINGYSNSIICFQSFSYPSPLSIVSSSNLTPFYGIYGDIVPSEVYIHYNGLVEKFEGNSITLEGSWSESNDNYTYNNSYTYTDVYYIDQYGRNKSYRSVSDIYFNGEYIKSYTGNQYTELNPNLTCSNTGSIIIYTGSDIPVRLESSTGNVFSQFVDNALLLISGNISGIITWIFIFVVMVFIIRIFIPKKRR